MANEKFDWSKSAIVINEHGAYRWPGFEVFQVRDAVSTLEAFAKAEPQRMRRCFSVESKSVDLIAQGSQAIFVYTLDKLHLNTWWRREGEKMVPDPAAKARRQGFQASAVWNLHRDMRMIYGACVSWNTEKWVLVQAVLFVQSISKKKAGNLLLPLPNLYTDGRVCLLSSDCDSELPSASTLAELAPLCLQQFNKTEWNAELNYDSARLGQLVQFNPANLEQYPIPDDWYTFCPQVNNSVMEAICA